MNQSFRPVVPLLIFCAALLFSTSGCLKKEETDKPREVQERTESQPSRTVPKPQPKPMPVKPKPVCGVTLQGSRTEEAEAYYVKGERYFNNDDIKPAKRSLETATCLNPKHRQAQDLLKLLKQTYP